MYKRLHITFGLTPMLVSCPLKNSNKLIWCSGMKVAPFEIFASVLLNNCFDFLKDELMRNCRLAVEEYATVSHSCTKQIKSDPWWEYNKNDWPIFAFWFEPPNSNSRKPATLLKAMSLCKYWAESNQRLLSLLIQMIIRSGSSVSLASSSSWVVKLLSGTSAIYRM